MWRRSSLKIIWETTKRTSSSFRRSTVFANAASSFPRARSRAGKHSSSRRRRVRRTWPSTVTTSMVRAAVKKTNFLATAVASKVASKVGIRVAVWARSRNLWGATYHSRYSEDRDEATIESLAPKRLISVGKSYIHKGPKSIKNASTLSNRVQMLAVQ